MGNCFDCGITSHDRAWLTSTAMKSTQTMSTQAVNDLCTKLSPPSPTVLAGVVAQYFWWWCSNKICNVNAIPRKHSLVLEPCLVTLWLNNPQVNSHFLSMSFSKIHKISVSHFSMGKKWEKLNMCLPVWLSLNKMARFRDFKPIINFLQYFSNFPCKNF